MKVCAKMLRLAPAKGLKSTLKNPQSISDDMTCYVTVSTANNSVICLRFNGTGIFIRRFCIVVFSCMIIGYFSLFGARQCHVIEQESFTNTRKYPKLLVFKIFF